MFKKNFGILKNIIRVALWQKISAVVFLFGSLAAAFTEMSFLGILYALFSIDKKAVILNWLKTKSFVSYTQLSFLEHNFTFLFIGFATIILILRLVFAITSRFSLASIQVKIGTRLSHKLFSCFIDTPPAIWTSWKKEKIVNIITYEAGASGKVVYTVMNIFMSILIMTFLIIGAYTISIKLTTFSVIIGFITLVINYANYSKARKIGTVKVQSRSDLLGHVYDVVSGHKIIKLENAESVTKAKMVNIINNSHQWLLEKTRNINTVMSISELFIYFLFFGLILMASAFKIVEQAILMTFLVLSIRLQGAVRDIQTQWIIYQELLPNFIDVQGMLAYANKYIIKNKEITLKKTIYSERGVTVKLYKVNFSYKDSGTVVIDDLNAIFPSGQRFLIKGISSSGKSTLINMICGILEPSSGAIFFDDDQLTRESFYDIRNYISYSSPDAYIFRGTIRDNISLGLDSTDAEVMDAIRKAGLEKFIGSLGNGIYSLVTDNAVNISLGERQRLMLARMFLKKPRLILLDEATSNLDLELEVTILKNLVENLPKATLIMVTHRAPNFAFDRRLELKGGKLININ